MATEMGYRQTLALWTSWGLGPIAWALHLLGSYMLVPWVCASGHHWTLHIATLFTLVVSLLGVCLAWRLWGKTGRHWPGGSDRLTSRLRFMAVGGIILSALSALLIVAEGIPNFYLGACL